MTANDETFSPEELETYLSLIKYDGSRDPNLENLKKLMLCHLSTVPFEDLDLHYHPSHNHFIDQKSIYDKITKRGRGGYCFHLNQIFPTLLRTLGYDIYIGAGRVAENQEGKFKAFTHKIAFVTLENQLYLVDVGFGGSNLLCPMPLIDGYQVKMIGNEEAKLVYQPLKYSKTQEPIWQYHHRYSPDGEWIAGYCFSLLEFFKDDFEVGNYFTANSKDAIFTQCLIVMKIVLKDGAPIARLLLVDDTFKLRKADGVEILKKCKNEKDRIEGLKEYFKIELTEEEINAIKGRKLELKEQQ